MSESISPQPSGGTRRTKRATRACNHCRWKRLKCSDQAQNESCMNCIIYGTKCEYTTAWPQQSEKRKDHPDRSSNGKTRPRKKQKNSDDEEGNQTRSPASRSPTEDEEETLEAECSGQSVTDAADPVTTIPDGAQLEADDTGLEKPRDPNSVLVHDRLGKELVHYLTPMMTGVDNEEDIGHSAEDAGLPPPQVTEALIDAYFQNVHPLYPIIDESSFRIQLQQYYQSLQHVDRLWLLLVKIMMCTGAAALHDAPSLGHDIKGLREELFAQVISSSYLIYIKGALRNTQVLVLIALYSMQINKLNSAWLWCRWAIRMQTQWHNSRDPRTMKEQADHQALKDMVFWASFMIESHLSLMQFRDDCRILESKLKQPSEEVKKKYPVFCYRLSLARLAQRFTRIGVEAPGGGSTAFTERFEQVHASILSWRESIPIGYQPEGDIFAEREEYQCVLFMHLEYHTLLLSMFTALGAASRLMPKDKASKNSTRVRNQIAIRISNARRLLQNITSITDTSHLKPCVSSWLNAVQILSPFSFIYSHIMRRPSLLSARGDLDLLYGATRHFRQYMAESPRNKNIASLITSMYDAAAKFVAVARASGSLQGPMTASAGALADNFSDLPGENTIISQIQTAVRGGEGEFDYSPTIDVETPDDPTGLGLHSGFVQAPSSFPFEFQGNYRIGHEGTAVPDVAWLAAPHGGSLSAASPHALGISTGGNGWEEWFWQNENGRHPPG